MQKHLWNLILVTILIGSSVICGTQSDLNHPSETSSPQVQDQTTTHQSVKIQEDDMEQNTDFYFQNPVVDRGADPWVILHEGIYYYCRSYRGGIGLVAITQLPEIGKTEPLQVWKPPENTMYSKQIWAPELHFLEGRWYIYFAADDGNNANHRMYVLESENENPMGTYRFVGKLSDPTNKWAIDGTVLQLNNGGLYFIWSGWEGDENIQQDLYIAAMSDPKTISGTRYRISSPEYAWERNGQPYVNEGPQCLWHNEMLFIIYSASGSWTDDYCLGQLRWTGEDPLSSTSWEKKEYPVFQKTEEVFGVGHASFTTTLDGHEYWIVYHAAIHQGSGWQRNVRIQPFTWHSDGSPNFRIPLPLSTKLRWKN